MNRACCCANFHIFQLILFSNTNCEQVPPPMEECWRLHALRHSVRCRLSLLNGLTYALPSFLPPPCFAYSVASNFTSIGPRPELLSAACAFSSINLSNARKPLIPYCKRLVLLRNSSSS
jgi:hypothetical protein